MGLAPVVRSFFVFNILYKCRYGFTGGISPLIPPNEFMPANIRLAHGFVLGFLVGQKTQNKQLTATEMA